MVTLYTIHDSTQGLVIGPRRMGAHNVTPIPDMTKTCQGNLFKEDQLNGLALHHAQFFFQLTDLWYPMTKKNLLARSSTQTSPCPLNCQIKKRQWWLIAFAADQKLDRRREKPLSNKHGQSRDHSHSSYWIWSVYVSLVYFINRQTQSNIIPRAPDDWQLVGCSKQMYNDILWWWSSALRRGAIL